jgi:hypothetical protein
MLYHPPAGASRSALPGRPASRRTASQPPGYQTAGPDFFPSALSLLPVPVRPLSERGSARSVAVSDFDVVLRTRCQFGLKGKYPLFLLQLLLYLICKNFLISPLLDYHRSRYPKICMCPTIRLIPELLILTPYSISLPHTYYRIIYSLPLSNCYLIVPCITLY